MMLFYYFKTYFAFDYILFFKSNMSSEQFRISEPSIIIIPCYFQSSIYTAHHALLTIIKKIIYCSFLLQMTETIEQETVMYAVNTHI